MDYAIQEIILAVNELDSIGINSRNVIAQYQIKKSIFLNLNELIKVSSNDEGKSINFETLDKISVTVPVERATGSWNKVD